MKQHGWAQRAFGEQLSGQRRRDPPTKFLQEEGLSSSFQDSGQATSTVLCFMPPRPADWIRWDMPSRRLEDTTSWQKPLLFSALIRDRMFCREARGQRHSSRGSSGSAMCQPHPTTHHKGCRWHWADPTLTSLPRSKASGTGQVVPLGPEFRTWRELQGTTCACACAGDGQQSLLCTQFHAVL